MTPEIAAEGIRFVLGPELISSVTGLIIIMIVSAIEKWSPKLKPWSWLFNKIGKLMNKDIATSVKDLDRRLEELEKRNDQQDATSGELWALSARRHIIAAADELKRGMKHSEEWYNSILEDVTLYAKYCDKHKDFINEKAVVSIQFIRDSYAWALKNNGFL